MNLRLLLPALLLPSLAGALEPPPAPATVQEQYAAVKKAEMFTIGGVGFTGLPSHQEVAFRALLKQPDAVARCQKLLSEATAAGQLYGLLGLRLLDPPAFAAALPAYRKSQTDVETMQGCVASHTTAATIVEKIEKAEIK